MKITKVETFLVKMPMIIEGNVIPTAGGAPRTSMHTLMVRIDTDEGVSGWGEGFGHRIFTATKAAIDSFIGAMCIGRDPTAINELTNHLECNVGGVGRNGPAMYAISAIDIALWDIAGKLAGLPLYRLLGGSVRRDLPGYASLLRYVDPATVASYAERALKRGYRHIKLHETTLPAIKAGREVAADIPVMLDCNAPWSADEAIKIAHQLEPLNLRWIEEPVWPPEDCAGLARVRNEGRIATASGENLMFGDFKRMFEAGSLTFAQPSVTKVGGVTGFRKVLALAEAFGVEVAPHSSYFGPGFLASIHCTAAMTKETLVERFDADFDVNPLHDAINPDKNGRFAVPQGPGLGIDPDPAVIEKLRVL